MPVIHADQAAVHQMHGTSFTAYASPARGSRELCAWHIEIPGHTEGVRHRVSREEVLYVLSGTIRASLDGQAEDAAAGDVIVVPAGAQFGVDNVGASGHRLGHDQRRGCSACCRTARGSARPGCSDIAEAATRTDNSKKHGAPHRRQRIAPVVAVGACGCLIGNTRVLPIRHPQTILRQM